MRSRKLLAFILCLITGPALAGYMTLLGAGLGAIQPVAQATFTNSSYSTNLSNLTSIATFSRAGNAMQFDSQGYLTYGPNNLLLNTATLGTQSVTVVVGVNYILSIKGTGSVTLTGASTAGPLNGTGASNRVDLKITAATTSLTLTVSGSVTSARLSAVTYETAFRACDDVDNTASAFYGARFDYTYNGSSWVPAGLLVEGAATNSFFGSSNPTNWSKLGVTAPSGQTAPDGSTNAATITASAGGTYHYSYGVGATATASQARVVSVFVKQGTAPYVNFGASGDASWHVGWLKWSDLSTGATNGTVTVYPLGGGLYRLALAYTMTNAVSTQPYVGPDTASRATAPNYSAAGTETVIAWGMQDEPGTIPSSYIPTSSGVAATRAAESVPVSAAVLAALQGTNGTVFYEGEGTPVTLAVFVGSITGNYALYTNNAASVISYNTTTAIIASGTYTQGALFRAGVSWSASGRSIALSGGAVTTDANPIGAFGSGYLGSNGASLHVNNHIKSFAIYNSRLPDATLQAKSVVGAAY